MAKIKTQTPMQAGFNAFRKGKTWAGVKKHAMLYLFVLPALILLAVFVYAPMFGIIIAFQDYTVIEGVFGSEFIGLDMFYRILFDPATASYREFRNTIYIALIRIATNFPVILIFTLLLNEVRNNKIKGTVQAISYIPYFISWISVGGMCWNLFEYDSGLFNRILRVLGLEKIHWYASPEYWWGILAISSLWKTMGWSTLIYLSGLGAIDDELYDACKIDGGGRIRQMVSVTIPGIMNVILLQLILDATSIMRDNYDQILALINGSQYLNETTGVIGSIEYGAVTSGSQYGRATAFGILRGLFGLVMVILSNKITRKTDNEGVL